MNSSRTRISEFFAVGAALFVSLATLLIYIYQAKMMREQQHVSVWPYVEWLSSNMDGYYFTARNKGVGPAIIKKVEMSLDGRSVENNRQLVAGVLGADWTLGFVNSTLEGRVLIPGEEVIPFKIPDTLAGRDFESKLRAHQFEMRITYCSVYGDCWVSSGTEVKPLPKWNQDLF